MESTQSPTTVTGYFRLPSEQPTGWPEVVVPGLSDTETSAESFYALGNQVVESPTAVLGGGWCRWLNLAQDELKWFWIIPEYGAIGFVPGNGPMYNVDGFWYKYVSSHWLKIPDGALVWVYKTSTGSLQLLVRTYIPGYYPEWRSAAADPPKIGYPW